MTKELSEKELKELEKQGLAKKVTVEIPIKSLSIIKKEIIEQAIKPLTIAKKKNSNYKGRPFELCPHGILGKSRCKECVRAKRNAYMKEYTKKNPDKFKVYAKRYAQTERCQKTRREYYKRNKEKILAEHRESLHRMKEEHPERYKRFLKRQRKRSKEYYEKNKEKLLLKQRVRSRERYRKIKESDPEAYERYLEHQRKWSREYYQRKKT